MDRIGFENREKRTEIFKMVLTKSEKQVLVDSAQQAGLTLSGLVRQALQDYLNTRLEK